jgi:two-component system, cell cycle sensor histidine kinase and response regulator CckA
MSREKSGDPTLRPPEERVRAQFRAIPVPTYAWQKTGDDGQERFELVDYNDAAAAITEGNIAGLIGSTLDDLYGPQSEIAADIVHCLRERTQVRREMDYTFMTTGSCRRLSVTYVPAASDIVLAYTDDVTERRQLEEQLRQAQTMEAVGQLAGGIAHDFNNLLTVIQVYSDSLEASLAQDSPLRGDVTVIRDAASTAASLTRQLLALSRKQVLQPCSLDLHAILTRLEPILRSVLGEAIDVRRSTHGDAGRVRADPGQMEQVILNLAVNARDAMPLGGTLTLETACVDVGGEFAGELRPGPHVRLRVRDTGHGMEAAVLSRIFDPFFTTKGPGRGTGLGLSTVYGIVKQSGGTVHVESEPGKGSCFDVLLPRVPEGTLGDEPPPSHTAATRGVTILLAEDEDALRAVVRRVLVREGYRVLDARDAADARRVAAPLEAIDILVTDVVMPGKTGRELYEELRALRPQLRVLYMSGYADDDVLRRGVEGSTASFIQKPFTTKALLEKVRTAIDAEANGG